MIKIYDPETGGLKEITDEEWEEGKRQNAYKMFLLNDPASPERSVAMAQTGPVSVASLTLTVPFSACQVGRSIPTNHLGQPQGDLGVVEDQRQRNSL